MKQKPAETHLVERTETRVRFSEVDAIGIVWHGNFVRYLEDGRESFGRKFGLGYFEVFKHELFTPIVKLEIDYKLQVEYGEDIIIETAYVNTEAAKIIFNYRIYRKSDMALVSSASSTQVFVSKRGELQLSNPAFYVEWKKNNDIR